VYAFHLVLPTRTRASCLQEGEVPDGERLPVVPRDLGSCEIFPQNLLHNCNGRFIVVCGDGEYIIYTSQVR
jgi:coatomer subunit beta'